MIVASILLAPAAVRGQALFLSGDLRGGYSRSDSGSEGAVHSTGTSWLGGARLTLSGSPFRPGLADLLLSGDYNDFRSVYDSGESRSRSLGLRSSASLLGGSALPVHLDFSRTNTDFLSDVSADRTGRSVVTSLGGGAVLRTRNAPMLRASVSRTEVDTSAPDGSESASEATRLSLGASQSVGAHRYGVAYDMGWERGTYAQNNFHSHALLLDYSGSAGTTLFHLSDRYYLRVPAVADRTNLRSDDNGMAAGVQWRAFGDGNASLGYSHRRATLRAEGGPDMELVSHSATQRLLFRRSRSLSLQGQLTASHGYQRRNDVERRAAAEAAGLDLSWSRVFPVASFYAGLGSSVGLVHPADGEVTTSLGATASGGLRASGLPFSPTATYSIAFQRRGAELSGWSLQQRLDVGGQGLLAGRYLRAALVLSELRREDAVLGESRIRSGTLLLAATGRRSTAQLGLGVTDSLGPGFEAPGGIEGVLVPSALTTRTWYGTFTASTLRWDGRLSLSAVVRTLDVVAPGRPEQWEHGLSFTASTAVGRMVMSAEERVSLARAGDGSRYANLVFVTLTRAFGTRIR